MPDSKATELTNLTSLAPTDLLYAVDDPSGAPVSKKVQASLLMTALNVKNYGAVGDGVADDTAAFQAAEDAISANGGGTIYVPDGRYLKDRTFPPANTTYIFDPGAVMVHAVGASNIWRINADNNHFFCNGALFDGTTIGATSSIFQYQSGNNCSIHDCNILGASGTGKDGINITGSATGDVTNLRIIGGKIDSCDRNGISVVWAKNVLIDGLEISNSNAAPGSGIDIEANQYDVVENITVQNCYVHDNGGQGIQSAFCAKTRFLNNRVEGNSGNGISIAAGGAHFDTGVYRIQDRRGVSAFDVGTGKITASDISNVGDGGIELGTWVIFNTTGTGAIPAELQAQTRWCVTWVDPSTNEFKLGKSLDYDEITSFSDAGAGTLSLDAEVSEVTLICYARGQTSDCIVDGNLLTNNGSSRDIFLSTGTVGCKVRNNVIDGIAGNIGISCSYARDFVLENNLIIYPRDHAGTLAGINIGACTNAKTRNNVIKYSGGSAIVTSDTSHIEIDGDYAYGCAHNGTTVVDVNSSPNSVLKNVKIRQDPHTTPTSGIILDNNSTNCIVENCNVIGVTASNAASISAPGSGNRLINNIVYDGSLVALDDVGSQTYLETNVSTDRAFDADAAVAGTGIDVAAAGPANVALLSDHDALVVVVQELADVVGTLIADLRAKGQVN